LNEAVFVPPPPHEIAAALGDWENFVHDSSPMPILIKIALAHAQFETIHPFLDGNGRVGRLLIAFLLCEREILQKPVLYISHYFKRHRERYYELLQNIRDHGDWESWTKFFLTGITEVSQEATETARRIVELRERHRTLITTEFGRVAANGLTVLESLYTSPIISINDIVGLTDVSFTAASQLMRKFESHGLLSETTGQTRNRRFRYGAYIDLFSNR
jgi:Fic family protein